MKPISIKEIAEAVSGEIIRGDLCKCMITGVSTDTRTIREGQLFIPVIGANYNANDFINTAFEKGAALALTNEPEKVSDQYPIILVKNTEVAMQQLAKRIRDNYAGIVIGITGSVGKTSCKEMLYSVISTKYKTHKTKGNFNNNIGLPLTLFDMPENTEVAILEMGMNNFGEIDLLAGIAQPNMGIITNIGVSHIENLKSRDGIFKAKCEMIKHIKENGVLIVNGDDDYLPSLVGVLKPETYTYGFNNDLQCSVITCVDNGLEGVRAIIKSPVDTYDITINALGKHMLYHAMTAILVGELLSIPKECIIKGIANYATEKMRLNIASLDNGITLINDAYNASVDSMKSSLDVLDKIQTSFRKVAILGDMLEMGEYSAEGHRQVGEKAGNANIDVVITIGSAAINIYNAVKDKKKAYYFESLELLLIRIKDIIMRNDVVLIKASRGMKLENTIEKIKEVQ